MEEVVQAVSSLDCQAEVLAGNHGLEASKVVAARGERFQHLLFHPCQVYFNLTDEQAGLVTLFKVYLLCLTVLLVGQRAQLRL